MASSDKFRRVIKEKQDLDMLSRIRQILTRMSPAERGAMVSYLKAFKEENSLADTLCYIEINPTAIKEDLISHLKVTSVKALEKQLERLIERIGESLILQINTDRKGAFSDATREEYSIMRKIMKVHGYIGKRNLPGEASIELDKAIRIAEKYESYHDLVKALYLKRSFLRCRMGSAGYADITRKIKQYEKCRDEVERIKEWYNEYVQFADFDGFRDGYELFFSSSEKEIDEIYQNSESDTVSFFYHIIKIGLLEETRRFSELEVMSSSFLSLVKESPALFRPMRVSEAYKQLADSLIYQKKFTESLKYIVEAKSFCGIAFNESKLLEVEFWALFYTGKYDNAERIINTIITDDNYSQSSYLENKYKYLHACSLFVLNRHKESSKALSEVNEISSDRKGWNIGIRILHLMLSFSEPDFEDLAFHSLEAFRGHLYDMKNKGKVRGRDQLIYKICNDLFRTSGNFNKVYNKRQEEFKLLESPDPEYGWQIKSHELIIFHEWFKCMMRKEKYSVSLSAEPELEMA